MAKTVTSDVICKDEVLCGSGDYITFLLDPHSGVDDDGGEIVTFIYDIIIEEWIWKMIDDEPKYYC